MANYKVKVMRVQGINKNTYKCGQIVSDDNFPKGNAAKLCGDGYLELIVENKIKTVIPEMEAKEEKAKTAKGKVKPEAKEDEHSDSEE